MAELLVFCTIIKLGKDSEQSISVNMAAMTAILKLHAMGIESSNTSSADSAGKAQPANPRIIAANITTEKHIQKDGVSGKPAVTGYFSWLVSPKPCVSKRDLNIIAPVST